MPSCLAGASSPIAFARSWISSLGALLNSGYQTRSTEEGARQSQFITQHLWNGRGPETRQVGRETSHHRSLFAEGGEGAGRATATPAAVRWCRGRARLGKR